MWMGKSKHDKISESFIINFMEGVSIQKYEEIILSTKQ